MRVLPFILVLAASCTRAPGQPVTRPVAKVTVAPRVREVLDSVKVETDVPRVARELQAVFDDALAYSPTSDVESFRAAAFGLRLATQVERTAPGKRAELFAYLRAHDQLAQTLVFLVKPEDDVKGVYALLDRLRAAHDDLDELASLASALCVVHDKPFSQRINENKVDAPDPVELFDYFRSERKSMAMPIASMPPELLICVVDAAAAIDDIRWSGHKYAGDLDVGKRYFDVKYDYEAFRKGVPKKVTEAGFSFRNVLTYGGVCADQAYFASHVGKSIGIPTAYVSGRNAEMAHAWVGYLEIKGGKAAWNFNSGHYPGYQGVRGETLDPQTRKRIPDSYLALASDASSTHAVSRRNAIAMTDAAIRLRDLAKSNAAFPAQDARGKGERKAVRDTGIEDRLALLEAGLRACPAYAPGWAVLTDAAKAGELLYKDKKRWADVLDRLCSGKYPDFSLDVFRPMIETVDDPAEQDSLWNSLFKGYTSRPDLAAEIRFAQGAMWDKAGDPAKAWDCYQDVIKRFADAGPFTVDAVKRCEKLLTKAGKEKDILPMYAALWPRLSAPKGAAPEFQSQSNWFRIGLMYSVYLDSGGQSAKAEEVRGKLGVPKK